MASPSTRSTRAYSNNKKNCGFINKDREIKAQLTIGCNSTEIRRKVLEKPAMTLDAVLNKARAIEAAVTQADRMEKETDQKALIMRRNRPTRNQQQTDRGICSFCGGQFHQRLSTCPARFHQFSNCLNIHHFEKFYRSSRRERSGQSSNIILKQQTKSYHPAKQTERTNVIIVKNSESDDEHTF
jgi:hypothetical protein